MIRGGRLLAPGRRVRRVWGEVIYPTDWYNSRGSPTFSISGIVHLRSKAFERTILKIWISVYVSEGVIAG